MIPKGYEVGKLVFCYRKLLLKEVNGVVSVDNDLISVEILGESSEVRDGNYPDLGWIDADPDTLQHWSIFAPHKFILI